MRSAGCLRDSRPFSLAPTEEGKLTDRTTPTTERTVRMAGATARFAAADHSETSRAAYRDPQTKRNLHERSLADIAISSAGSLDTARSVG